MNTLSLRKLHCNPLALAGHHEFEGTGRSRSNALAHPATIATPGDIVSCWLIHIPCFVPAAWDGTVHEVTTSCIARLYAVDPRRWYIELAHMLYKRIV
jgi:hypothetical protein